MTFEEEQKRNSYKPITENPIVLDFTGCRYLGQIHRILKEKFGLPEYYGENWDALWDCLGGLFYRDGEIVVEIRGYLTLRKELREACIPMLEVFDDVHADTPNVRFTLVS